MGPADPDDHKQGGRVESKLTESFGQEKAAPDEAPLGPDRCDVPVCAIPRAIAHQSLNPTRANPTNKIKQTIADNHRCFFVMTSALESWVRSANGKLWSHPNNDEEAIWKKCISQCTTIDIGMHTVSVPDCGSKSLITTHKCDE